MGKYERERGARYERHIAEVLREHGYEAERGCQHAGGKDSPDVKHNMKGCHIECKKTEHLRIWEAIAQSERDAGEDEIPVVVFSRNRSKDYVILNFEEFIEIFKGYEKGQNDGDQEENQSDNRDTDDCR